MIELLAGLIVLYLAINLGWLVLWIVASLITGTIEALFGVALTLGQLAALLLRPLRIWLDRIHPPPPPRCSMCELAELMRATCVNCGKVHHHGRPTQVI